MRFGHLELPVRDTRASLAFYKDVLGFRLVADQGGGFAWIEKGGLEILLLPRDAQPGTCAVFYTSELEAQVEGLRARGLELERKGNCHHFHDPDGHEFQVVNPTDNHTGEG